MSLEAERERMRKEREAHRRELDARDARITRERREMLSNRAAPIASKPAPAIPGSKVRKKNRGAGRPAGPDPVAPCNLTIPKKLCARAKDRAKAEGKTLSVVVSELLAGWLRDD